MSIGYNLYIETEAPIKDVFGVVANSLGVDSLWENTYNRYSARFNDVTAVATAVESKIEKSLFAEEYDFVPTIGITFGFRQLTEQRIVSRSVVEILENISGNAVFLYNGEETILQRINGNLTLDKSWSEKGWLGAELSESNLKYNVEKLHSPFLEPQEEMQAA